MPALDSPSLTDPAISRRAALLGGVGAASLLLAACSSGSASGSDYDNTAGADSSAASGSGDADAFPVTLPGKEGSAKVQSAPRRVVAYGFLRDTDLALALGAGLVGVARSPAFPTGVAPWQQVPSSATLLDMKGGAPFEKIASLRPDLILAADDYTLPDDYANLSRIAPTASYQRSVGADSWQTMITRAGRVFGRSDKASELVRTTLASVAGARAQNPVLDRKTFTFGPVTGPTSANTISSTQDASVAFFQQLGMRLSPGVRSLPMSSTPGRSKLSLEQLDRLDADVLMLTFASDEVRTAFERQPTFRKLAAVQRGSYIAMDYAAAIAVAFPSVLSIPYGLTTVVPQLAAAARRT